MIGKLRLFHDSIALNLRISKKEKIFTNKIVKLIKANGPENVLQCKMDQSDVSKHL